MEREDESKKRMVVFKSYKDKIVIEWEENSCKF